MDYTIFDNSFQKTQNKDLWFFTHTRKGCAMSTFQTTEKGLSVIVGITRVSVWSLLLTVIFYSAMRHHPLAEIVALSLLSLGLIALALVDLDYSEAWLEYTAYLIKELNQQIKHFCTDFSETAKWLWNEILKSFN